MTTPHFFGYGSLVHRGTHDYLVRGAVRLRGWRRIWRHSARRDVAFLTVHRAPGSEIDGLVAEVPGGDWAALDAREHAYLRVPLGAADVEEAETLALHVYEANPIHTAPPSLRHPVLLSYLDTVIGGYLAEFGRAGAEAFFATTDGWDAPVLDDRDAPIYPRAIKLGTIERDFVDAMLQAVDAERVRS